MDMEKLIQDLKQTGDESSWRQLILETLLPTDGSGALSLDKLDQRLKSAREEIESLQRQNNDRFDAILDSKTIERINSFSKNLHDTQLGIMKLQCDIAFTKEQCTTLKTTCDNSLVQEHRELLMKENDLKKSLHQVKFDPPRKFFEMLAFHLNDTIAKNRKSCTLKATGSDQLFDWTQYHQAIFLLRVCGKALIDVERFERLYQSNIDILSITFRQPVERLDFSHLIGFQDNQSLESLIEILASNNRRRDLKEFMSDPDIERIVDSREPLTFTVFDKAKSQLASATSMCCELLIDLNLNYIEAYLTEGINIDKLNNHESGTSPQIAEPTLPMYAFSPQEYITQIGQHLLTLRQRTEQFDGPDCEPLRLALESLENAPNVQLDVKSCKSVCEIIMKCIARLCIQSLLGRTGNSVLSRLTGNGRRQLATDALYLDNVLEDLGLISASEPNVEKFKALLVIQ